MLLHAATTYSHQERVLAKDSNWRTWQAGSSRQCALWCRGLAEVASLHSARRGFHVRAKLHTALHSCLCIDGLLQKVALCTPAESQSQGLVSGRSHELSAG